MENRLETPLNSQSRSQAGSRGRRRARRISPLRWTMLAVILGGSLVMHYLHAVGGVLYPSVHAICPYGGIENLWAWLSARANISKIFSGTMVLFFLTAGFALVFGRSFCGNICPFGALQELLSLPFGKKRVPARADRPLRWLKYVLLAVSAVMAWVTATLWLSPFDPWAALAHVYDPLEMVAEFTVGAIVLLLVVVGSLYVSRGFCKYLCPAGAIYALLSKVSPLKIVRDPATCINCGKCSRECPMDIEVHTLETVCTGECIACMRCVDVCPGSGTMIAATLTSPTSLKKSTTLTGRRRVNPLAVIAATLVVFFGSLALLDASGLYRVSLPALAEVASSGDFVRLEDLRGSMTIEQGAIYSGQSLEAFYSLMEIPAHVPKGTQLKSVANYAPGYDFHAVKARKSIK